MARPVDPTLRDRLLDAAAQQFAARGFAGTSMAAVGAGAGVTKGGVYLHFAGKEELFFAVVDRWREALRARLTPLGPGPAADRLHAFVRVYLAFHFAQPAAASLLRVVATEMAGRFTAQVREDVRNAQRALRQQLRELLAEGTNDGTLFADDPASAAFVLAGALEGIVAQWLTSPRDAEPFGDPETLARALLASYRTGRRAPPRRPAQPRPAADDDAAFQPVF
jgi:AcrR family transcriptional regulator